MPLPLSRLKLFPIDHRRCHWNQKEQLRIAGNEASETRFVTEPKKPGSKKTKAEGYPIAITRVKENLRGALHRRLLFCLKPLERTGCCEEQRKIASKHSSIMTKYPGV